MGSHADIDRHVKTYMFVFLSLMFLTIVTVAVSRLELSTASAIGLALFIATIKGSLVASFFMHLISERKLIIGVLILTVVFFFVLLLVPMWTSLADQNVS